MAEGDANDFAARFGALVQEALNKAPPPRDEDQGPPRKRDIFWLAVMAADVAFLFLWFPEDAKGPLEFLKEFLPWLLGGTFIALNDLFREDMLKWIRLWKVRIPELVLLIVGIVVSAKVIPLRLTFYPDGTTLTTSLQKTAEGEDHERYASKQRFWLRLRTQYVYLIPPGGDAGRSRPVEISWESLFTRNIKELRMLYQADITPNGDGEITVRPKEGELDEEFLKPKNLSQKDAAFASSGDGTVRFTPSEPGTKTVVLPVGKYSVSSRGCNMPMTLDVKPLNSVQSRGGVDLRNCMLYSADIAYADEGAVEVHSEGGDFDPEFFAQSNLAWKTRAFTKVQADKIRFEADKSGAVTVVMLPAGMYTVSAKGCEAGVKLEVQPANSTQSRGLADLRGCGKRPRGK